MKRKVFTIALALFAAASTWAQTTFTVDNLEYTVTDETANTVELTGYATKPTGTLDIPATVSYYYNSTTYSVTSIGNYAFAYCSALTQVTIPESVTSIGSNAFDDCYALTAVYYTGDVAGWCGITFSTYSSNPLYTAHNLYINNNLVTELVIPEGVTSIGNYAFDNCSSIISATLPNSVTNIGVSAFYGCSSLASINIPEGVKSIGYQAFQYCSALTAVYYTGDVAGWCGITFDDYDSNPLYYAQNLYIGNTLVTELVIPEGVTEIKAYAFYGCSALTQVTIPESVTSIGDWAFNNCDALTAVYYTGDVAGWCGITFNTYKSNPLYTAHNLYINNNLVTELVIPEGVTEIKDYAFYRCSALTQVTIPESVTSIGDEAFNNCDALTQVTWNAINCEDFKSSNSSPFYDSRSNITTFTFGEQVEHIPAYLCYGMDKLTQITIPESVTSIGEGAFSRCSALTKITIPDGVTSIGDYAFYGCYKLTQITIPNSVTSIGEGAFSNCSKLTQVTIGNSVTSIGEQAFEGCQLSVYKNLSTTMVTPSILIHSPALDTLVCPAEELNVITDQELLSCSKQVKSIEVHSGTVTAAGFAYIKRQQNTLATLDMGTTENTELDNLALYDCYALEKLTLPAGLERIGYKAVAECVGLQAIDIPAGVTEIDDRAFENCRSISSISFGQESGQKSTRSTASSLKRIGNWAFYNCHQLQELAIPEGVTEIGNAAFYGCTYLENLELPASVQAIGDNCFALCSKLQAITVQATTPPTIAAKTFYAVNRDIPVYVPADALEDYQNDTYWQEFNLHAMPATGLQTPSMPKSISVYGGMLHNPQQLPVSLYDMQGRMVYSGTAATVSQPAGVYVLRCAGASGKVLF